MHGPATQARRPDYANHGRATTAQTVGPPENDVPAVALGGGGLRPLPIPVLLNGKGSLAALGLSSVVVNLGFPGSWQAVSIYMLVLAVISFASVLGLKELTRADITNVEADNITESDVVLAATD